MRIATLVMAVILPLTSLAQKTAPPWPQMMLGSCPTIAANRDPSQRTWKHGQIEQDEFLAAVNTKDRKQRAELLSKFTAKYPDSDYREPALYFGWLSYISLQDNDGQLRTAELMVQLPEAEALTRTDGFMTLAGGMSPYVRPDDAQKEHKLADLEKWTQCGSAASAMIQRPPNVSEDAFQKPRRYEESIFDRTSGFVAYMRQNYALANTKLEAASKLNSQDPLTYLWLGTSKLLSPGPDLNSGIFYWARGASLAPPEARESYNNGLKQMYVVVHGSDKGLSDVKKLAESNTEPPPGFDVLPKVKEKHHYGSAIAAAVIVGLLAYGLAANPELTGEEGRAINGSSAQPQEAKLMIFGGQDHRVYLGCLSCSELEKDSVFNALGSAGSRVSTESIWNPVGQYGSPSALFSYSACNSVAKDPPVIVDQDGTAYGRLTLNRLLPQIGMGARFYDWLASSVCQQ
jgi:hypothetical protein